MDTEARIFAAAQALLQGEHKLSMAQVARQAGISRSELYRRFSNKQALLDALVKAGSIDAQEGTDTPARERILDALASLLAQGGLKAATLEKIAQCAQVGQVTIYRLFGDRQGLLHAFAAERTPRARFVHQKQNMPNPDDEEELTRWLRSFALQILTFFCEHPHFLRMTLAPEPELLALMEGERSSSGSMRAALARIFQNLHDKGRILQDPNLLSVAFFGMLLGMSLHTPNPTPEECQHMASFAVHTLLHGQLSPSPPDPPGG